MKPLVMFFLFSGMVYGETSQTKLGNVLEEGYLDPTVEEANMPGTRKAIEDINTSPNPAPQAEEYRYNDVLIDGEYIQDQGNGKGKKSQKSEEDVSEESL